MKFDYNIYVSALVGKSFRSDIAIDDLRITDGECPTCKLPAQLKSSRDFLNIIENVTVAWLHKLKRVNIREMPSIRGRMSSISD